MTEMNKSKIKYERGKAKKKSLYIGATFSSPKLYHNLVMTHDHVPLTQHREKKDHMKG